MSEDDAPIEADQALCIHCTKPYNGLDHFCPHCGGPVSQHSSVDPMGQVFALGHAYSSATSGRSSKLVLIGMWILFGPQLLLVLVVDFWVAIEFLSPDVPASPFDSGIQMIRDTPLEEAIKLLVLVGLTGLYGLMLYKVTAGYLRKRKEHNAQLIDD